MQKNGRGNDAPSVFLSDDRGDRKKDLAHFGATDSISPSSLVSTPFRFGDWEGDLVVGSRNPGAITTHVERRSRYLKASLLENRMAETFNAAATPVYQQLPEALRQTLTVDNSKEFSRFK